MIAQLTMKLLILVSVATLVVCGAIASPVADKAGVSSKAIVADGNEFVDAVLANLREKAIEYGLDPMQLPDELHDFSVTFLFIRYHGELYFTKGWLQNLSTIVRSGDAVVSQVGQILEMKTYVQFDRLFMTYEYVAQIMNVGPKGDVIGYVDDLKLSTDIIVNLDTCEATLKDLFISDAGKLDVHLDGTWFFDVIFNATIDIFTMMFKNVILKIIESNIRTAIETTLPLMDFAEVTGVACGPAVLARNHFATNNFH